MDLAIGTILYDFTGKHNIGWELVAKCIDTNTVTLLSSDGIAYGHYSVKKPDKSRKTYNNDVPGTGNYINSAGLANTDGITNKLRKIWDSELSPLLKHKSKEMEIVFRLPDSTNYIHKTRLRPPTTEEPYKDRYNNNWLEYMELRYEQYRQHLQERVNDEMEYAHEVALDPNGTHAKHYRPPKYYRETAYTEDILDCIEYLEDSNILGDYSFWLMDTDLYDKDDPDFSTAPVYVSESEYTLEETYEDYPEIRGVIALDGETKVYPAESPRDWEFILFTPETR